MSEKEEFNFKDWGKSLPREAVKLLTEGGFDSAAALTNATEDDIYSLGMKRGN